VDKPRRHITCYSLYFNTSIPSSLFISDSLLSAGSMYLTSNIGLENAFCKIKQYLSRFRDYCKWLYFQYLIITTLYGLLPSERLFFNVIVVLILLTASYSTYVYLPPQLLSMKGLISNSILRK
jgi:hypothetical protein